MSSFTVQEWAWMDRQSSVASLDSALVYLRRRLGTLAPMYVVTVIPLTLMMVATIDVVSTQQRSLVPVICLGLTFATLWRWVGLAIIQRRVQGELRGHKPLGVWGRLHKILFGRLVANVAMTWGSLLLVPGVWGFFASGFVAPVVLEAKGPVTRRLLQAIPLASGGRLLTVTSVLLLGTLLVLAGLVGLQFMLLYFLLPSVLGLNAVDLTVTLKSMAWMMTMALLLFLLFDFYWAIASVFVFYDQQSRRLGTDLRLRLASLEETGK